VRVLAITGTTRLPQLPDVPTFTEAGLVEDVPVWTALFAPAGTPNAVVDALHGALVRWFASPVVRERALQLGNIPAVGTPDDLRATIARDIARVDALARRLGLTAR
jgi:tripartite-type tricarboxylate transporter receptor subunit TctC